MLALKFAENCLNSLYTHIEELSNPSTIQDNIFKDIVLKNSRTVFAKEMGFSNIGSFDEYRESQKITSYQDYQAYINRIIEGDRQQLTVCPTYMLLKTSGTTGLSKMIPKNIHWRTPYRTKAISAQWGLYEKLCPGILSDWKGVIDLSWQRKTPEAFIGGLPYQSITNRSSAISIDDWMPPWYTESWFSEDSTELISHLQNVLVFFLEKDVKAIVSVNPSTIILLDQLLKENSEQLLYKALKANSNQKNLKKLEYYKKLLQQNEKLSLGHIWPNMRLISCWKSGGASLYLKEVSELFPNAITVPFSSLGTEGVVAIPVDEHPSAMPLAINQGLFEFLPQGDGCSTNHCKKTLKFNELSVGSTYQLITTQANGLYRYNTDDYYKVVEYYKGVPRIEYMGRGATIHSFTGEKLCETDLIAAIEYVENELGINLRPFYCVPTWASVPFYKVYIPAYSKNIKDLGLESIASKIDERICVINEEYGHKRFTRRLNPVVIELRKEEGVFNRKELGKAGNISGLQKKYRIIRDRDNTMVA
ncbi:MAG: hypothetical protein HON42_00370 [Alphaproteobacteria bacterium]|jgi:hypothetical protein|nr:hypothetical protein [Alphaproteobacteria bacterium]